MRNKILNIDLNEEYKIKIEDADKLDNSYFKDIYIKAGKAVEDILEKSIDANRNRDKVMFARQKEEYNNIISFCGERGTGKTSAMITFAQSLVKIKYTNGFYEQFKLLGDYSFHYIDVIDPSLFEDNEHIFEVILSQLFSCFTNELNKNREQDQDKKRVVLELFQKVYENLKTVQKNGDKYHGEALETLSQLACSANLRNNFSELVQKYLDFITPHNDNNPCLIIPIDDFDLNIKAVAVMAEQIRKYLMIPNVIILMAADIKQLSDAKEQSLITEFETLISKGKLYEDTRIITERYISKLIPAERRLLLPVISANSKLTILKVFPIDSESNSNLLRQKLKSLTNEEEKNEQDIKSIEWKCKDHNIEEYLCSLIYEKTGLIFLPNSENKHFIIPNNLRKIKELVLLLVKMGDDISTQFYVFKDFFYNNILSDKLTRKEFNLIDEFRTIESNHKNKFIIDAYRQQKIDEYIITNNKEPENDFQSVKFIEDNSPAFLFTKGSKSDANILDRANVNANISLGDVMYFFNKMRVYYNDKKNIDFYNAIKCAYTLEIHQLLKIEKEKEKAQLLVGESFITEFPLDKKIPSTVKKQERQIFNIVLSDKEKLNLKNPNREILLLNYFISHFGKNYYQRRAKKNAPFFQQEVVMNNNLINVNEATINVFSFLSNSLNLDKLLSRIDYDNNEIKKEFTYDSLVLPIYSLDLIDEVFKKDFSRISTFLPKENDEDFIYKVIKETLAEIGRRLETINIPFVSDINIYDSFIKAPFVRPFLTENNNKLKQMMSEISLVDANGNRDFIHLIKNVIEQNRDQWNYKSLLEFINTNMHKYSHSYNLDSLTTTLSNNPRNTLKHHYNTVVGILENIKNDEATQEMSSNQ